MPSRLPARALLAVLAGSGLAACALDPAQLWRLQVRTVDDWPDPARLSRRIEEVGGVQVPQAPVQIAPGWYAVSIDCPSRSDCRHAMMKLAAQPGLFLELRRDDHRPSPARPSGQQTS